jgi:integrase
VETIKNDLKHLNPACESLFQRPKDANTNKFDVNNMVWYANAPVGEKTLGELLRNMTKRAGIVRPLTNHSIRATSVTVLANANVETLLIKSVTGHKSDTSIESYSSRPSSRQQQVMSSKYISPSNTATATVNSIHDKENQNEQQPSCSFMMTTTRRPQRTKRSTSIKRTML